MEIASLLEISIIDRSIVQGSQWPDILRYLIHDLAGKIVRRSTDSLKKTSERIAKGYRFIADSFYFEREGRNCQFVLVATQIEPARGRNVNIKVRWPV
jgi:hypothetical protein